MTLKHKAGWTLSTLFLMTIGVMFSLTDIRGGVASAITATFTEENQCLDVLNQKEGLNLTSSDVRISATSLNKDGRTDYIIQKISDENCGSAGCVFELCLSNQDTRGVQIVPFGLAGTDLQVKDSLTNNMKDLQLTGNSTTNLQWDGVRYVVLE